MDTPMESGIHVRDLLLLNLLSDDAYLIHSSACVDPVYVSNLRKLTATGQREHAELLNAKVNSIQPGPYGIELKLTDISPQKLTDFNEALERSMKAEREMGDPSR